MLKIELTSYGLDDTLKEIMDDLSDVLGNSHSKRRKDEAIYKTLGSVKALFSMIHVIEEKSETDTEEECGFLI